MVMLPSLTSQLKLTYGWRPTLMAVGAVQATLGAVAAAFLLRRPEDFGLAPDGAAEAEASLSGLSGLSSIELARVQRREAGLELADQEVSDHVEPSYGRRGGDEDAVTLLVAAAVDEA